MACEGSMQLQCPICTQRFCVPAVCRGVVVWHRGCDGGPLNEVWIGSCAGFQRAVVSWFTDKKRNEVRVCAEG